MRFIILILSLIIAASLQAQTLGGDAAFNFLKLPSSPQQTAAGGINVSRSAKEVSNALQSPALLNASLHSQLDMSFASLPGGIKGLNLAGAVYSEDFKTTFAGKIFYLNYGDIPQTDASGNQLGNFHPADYVVQVSAAKQYLEKWHYGLSVKFIHSQYAQYRSSALAFDFGVHYLDSIKNLSIGVTASNMGSQLKTYAGNREDLPFDLQVGISKKLSKAPFAFSVTAQQIHRFDLLYRDTVFNTDNNFSTNTSFFNKAFNHFVLATHIYIGSRVEATLGYNHLRRNELNLGTSGNGLTGFSAGFSARFEKMHISFARSAYQNNIAYNQLGLVLVLNKLSGLGKL